MNWFDWTILGAVVVLWLRLEVLFHKHDVLRGECSRWSNESANEVTALHRRLNRLDPPRRRATDKPKAAKR